MSDDSSDEQILDGYRLIRFLGRGASARSGYAAPRRWGITKHQNHTTEKAADKEPQQSKAFGAQIQHFP